MKKIAYTKTPITFQRSIKFHATRGKEITPPPPSPLQKNYRWILKIFAMTPLGMGNKDHNKSGRLDHEALIKVIPLLKRASYPSMKPISYAYARYYPKHSKRESYLQSVNRGRWKANCQFCIKERSRQNATKGVPHSNPECYWSCEIYLQTRGEMKDEQGFFYVHEMINFIGEKNYGVIIILKVRDLSYLPLIFQLPPIDIKRLLSGSTNWEVRLQC